jgi:hypothetical protein
MLFATRRNRIFLDTGTFHCKKALAPVTIQLDQHRMLLTSSRKENILGCRCLGSLLVVIKWHQCWWQFSCIQIVCCLLEDATDYSRRQVPSVVVCCQMAPALMTSQFDQNHIVFTSSQKRMFSERGTFRWPECTYFNILSHFCKSTVSLYSKSIHDGAYWHFWVCTLTVHQRLKIRTMYISSTFHWHQHHREVSISKPHDIH